MKRDMNLCREILFEIEKLPTADEATTLKLGRDPFEVSYHIMLLHEAGLIDGFNATAENFCWEVHRMTWKGHEFLDAARNETIWKKTIEIAKSKGLGLTLDLAMKYLTLKAAEMLGIDGAKKDEAQ